jgi:DNA segregation ATPase FtsK/SpoIIIE-like protein
MYPLKPQFDLPKLRRQLEEILALVTEDNGVFVQSTDEETAPSVHESDTNVAGAGDASVDKRSESEIDCESLLLEDGQPAKPDDLYNDALVVVTEFGQASAAILQMWLSIDYSRASTILNRFQAEGLISSTGRVRHKAFSLLRSLDQQT